MKKKVVIAVAVLLALLALLAAAAVKITTKPKEDSPPVRIIEDNNEELLNSQNALIAEQRAKIEELERTLAQQEFDYSALQSEKEKLERRSKDLESQNSWLRGRNSSLSSSENKLKDDISALNKDISALNEELARIDQEREANEAAYREALARIAEYEALSEELARVSQERDANEAAYQEALARIEEYEAKSAVAQAQAQTETQAQEQDQTPAPQDELNIPDTQTAGEEVAVSAPDKIPLGQSRNIFGIKAGETDIDIEAAFALMPHWFLVTEIGIIDAPDDFVEKEFPGLTADHAFMYTALFGTGLNWRVNALAGQPNFYIETMLGPAIYRYINKTTDEKGVNTYLLWRSAIGFDLTLYKSLQFTTEVGLDYIINCELTPRVTIGLQWNFSNNWALFGSR
ncbi:MAG: hypothetical protein J6U56_09190 [Spirochaetia bacterium]|nr:hypothetical protein [Spirochaetia bacterium]